MEPRNATAAPADESLDEAAYGTLVEEAFIQERGTPFFLMSKDWQLIRAWRETGVPVETVIRGVREAFERRRHRGSVEKICSLDWCQNAVETRWELERRGLVGRRDVAREDALAPPAERLSTLATKLGELAGTPPPEASGAVDVKALGKALEKAREKVAALDPTHGWDQLEDALLEIETKLLASLERKLGKPLAEELRARVEEDLGPAGSVSAEARELTRRALMRREVRRTLGLPPLTLFDV